jgi:hypothetical protein
VALAGLVPVPVTTQLTVFVPVVAPNRVTVKVKALLPELPSVCTALVGAIANMPDAISSLIIVPVAEIEVIVGLVLLKRAFPERFVIFKSNFSPK